MKINIKIFKNDQLNNLIKKITLKFICFYRKNNLTIDDDLLKIYKKTKKSYPLEKH